MKRSEVVKMIEGLLDIGLDFDKATRAGNLLGWLEEKGMRPPLPGGDLAGIIEDGEWEPEQSEPNLLTAAGHAEELACSLRELDELTKADDRNQLNAGMHMMSVYEKLIKEIEEKMHPAYVKNLDDFRAKLRNKNA